MLTGVAIRYSRVLQVRDTISSRTRVTYALANLSSDIFNLNRPPLVRLWDLADLDKDSETGTSVIECWDSEPLREPTRQLDVECAVPGLPLPIAGPHVHGAKAGGDITSFRIHPKAAMQRALGRQGLVQSLATSKSQLRNLKILWLTPRAEVTRCTSSCRCPWVGRGIHTTSA